MKTIFIAAIVFIDKVIISWLFKLQLLKLRRYVLTSFAHQIFSATATTKIKLVQNKITEQGEKKKRNKSPCKSFPSFRLFPCGEIIIETLLMAHFFIYVIMKKCKLKNF